MGRERDRRGFNMAVLDEVAKAYQRVLTRSRVKPPSDDATDLHAWAKRVTTTRGKGNQRFHNEVFKAAIALRELRALQALLMNGDSHLNDTVARLFFACGPKADTLRTLFSENSHAHASARGQDSTREHYWEARWPLLQKAVALQALDPELTNAQAARRVIGNLDQTQWDQLMTRRVKTDKRRRLSLRTEEAVQNQIRVLAKLLGIWNRLPDRDLAAFEPINDWASLGLRFRIQAQQAMMRIKTRSLSALKT